MESPYKHASLVTILVAIIGAIGVIVAGLVSYRATIDAAQIPISATLTAEAHIALTRTLLATAQDVSTGTPVPPGSKDEEVRLGSSPSAHTLIAPAVVTNSQTTRPTSTGIGTDRPATDPAPTDPATSVSESQPLPVGSDVPAIKAVQQTATPADIRLAKIRVTGTGMAPANVTNPTQREALAITAAEATAKAHIAEWLAGSEVEAVTIVSLGALVTDTIKTKVSATVPPTARVSEHYDPATNVATVVLELQLPPDE